MNRDRLGPGAGSPAGRTVAVAMSGGIDSSAAAALLFEAGWTVFGLTMDTGYTGEAARLAGQAAGSLGIGHHIVDLRERFKTLVALPFCRDYSAGLTPNPCLVCNRWLKFGDLLFAARRMGADLLATGHYVRADETPPGIFRLLRGQDSSKDQSYFLYSLGQEQLARSLFPLGAMTKEEVRAYASSRGLPAGSRSESQDICFVAGSDYPSAIIDLTGAGPIPGAIADSSGRHIGEHRGLLYYTVGQRRALGVTGPGPSYVLAIDHGTNTLVVGRAGELESRWLVAGSASFVSGRPPADGCRLEAKVRYRGRLVGAVFRRVREWSGATAAGPCFRLDFDTPQRAVAPGQAAVLYDGDEVVGGGIIITSQSREGALSGLRALRPGDQNQSFMF